MTSDLQDLEAQVDRAWAIAELLQEEVERLEAQLFGSAQPVLRLVSDDRRETDRDDR